MSILFYRRPDYVARAPGPLNPNSCAKYLERTKHRRGAIPGELSFENVVENKALPPCSLEDFMDYLLYVEHDAENLQFYLWLRDYTKRFNDKKKEDQVLSPEWNPHQHAPRVRTAGELANEDASTLWENAAPPIENQACERSIRLISPSPTLRSPTLASPRSVDNVFSGVSVGSGLDWDPFTIQPFRGEVNKVMAHYIAPNSSRELNISHRDREAIMHALQHTTHPSAFSLLKSVVELTLRGQSHPNFIRWSICNGNTPRVVFARTMGVSNTLLALGLALFLCLSSFSRWWRLFIGPLLLMSISILVAAYKGLCLILHKRGRRNMKPWERDYDNDPEAATKFGRAEQANFAHAPSLNSQTTAIPRSPAMQAFGHANKWREESWVEKYRRKSLVWKVFDKTVWVQDQNLKKLQDRIVLQSNLWSVIITIPLMTLFVALPPMKLF